MNYGWMIFRRSVLMISFILVKGSLYSKHSIIQPNGVCVLKSINFWLVGFVLRPIDSEVN